MSIQPESAESDLRSPLRGFKFTRDWLAEVEFTRRYLDDACDLMRPRIEAIDAGQWQPWSQAEVEDVRQFNLDAGNDVGAGLVDALAQQDTLAIVTGQQPDFLAAPLYVLHKALSAAAWAKKISAELGRRVVPVFWVASDDDDFAELKKAWLVSFGGELIDAGSRISRGKGRFAGTPAYDWTLADSFDRVKPEIERALAGWPGGEENARDLLQVIRQYPNFETQFCHFLARMLGPDFPVLFVAPRLKVFRQRQGQVLARDIEKHGTVNTAISRMAEEFREAGYPVTLFRDPDALNFFWVQSGRRHRLARTDGLIVASDPHGHGESGRFTEEQLRRMLETEPESFAPNVVTRPVVQDVSLPTAAYIAGPGELSYLAVLGVAYKELECSRSAVIPRTMVAMDPQGVLKEWTGCDSPDNLADAVLTRGGTDAQVLLDQINDLMADARDNLQRMRETSISAQPEVKLALDKTEQHILHGVEHLKRRLARQVASEQWKQAARISAMVAPAGSVQERMLAPWNFMKTGDWAALATHLADHVDYASSQPQTAPIPPWLKSVL